MLYAMMLQLNNTNQTLLAMVAQNNDYNNKRDSIIWPKIFVGLPTKDVLTWLDHFDNIGGYHLCTDYHEVVEARTLCDGVVTTWFT
jgi:hypothetical protein